MNDKRKDPQVAAWRVKQSLLDVLMDQTDEEILEHAKQDGIDPDEARSRVLNAFQKAHRIVTARPVDTGSKATSKGIRKKGTVLNMDAAKARSILKRVATRRFSTPIPLPNAAQLDQVKADEDAVKMVSVLKEMGIVSDDELE